MRITSHFDSGSIEVVKADKPSDIQLKIRKDSHSDFLQWFYFRVSGVESEALTMHFLNASETSYPDGWPDYQVVASYDRQEWFRIPTSFDGKVLTAKFTPQYNDLYFAYFAPYTVERHLDLIAWAQLSPLCQLSRVCQTVEGRDVDLLQVGEPGADKAVIWITARQHPGESMGEWFIEGLLERLLDEDDPVSRSLLNKSVFYIVPNINPDGVFHGNLRTNAAGANLNREWQNPTQEKSPEVFYVRELMHKTGVDAYLDVHGDEAIPYNFVAGCDEIPGYDAKHKHIQDSFKAFWQEFSPDFQVKHGYPVAHHQIDEYMTMATSYIGSTFKCLAYTIEMPFKDNFNLPDPEYGWSPERCKRFGASVLGALLKVLPELK